MSFRVFHQQFNNPFMTLRNPNYRIYWSAMSVSSIGTWMQNVAQPWLAYSMTDSPLLLGVVSAVQFLPLFLFSLFAGVLIDRFPRKRLLMFTQIAAGVLSLTMFLLVNQNIVRYWHILLIAALMGTVNAVNFPVRQVFISELVDKENLMNAVALYSTAFNFARIVGPALAGFIMAWLGIGICYLINCFAFFVVVGSLFFIRIQPEAEKPPAAQTVLGDIMEGLHYALDNKQVRDIIFVTAVTGIFAINFSVLLPVLAIKVLAQNEVGFGFLMSTVGIGTFLGAFTVASFSKNGPQRFFLFKAPLIIALLLIFIGICRQHYLIYLALALTGFFYLAFSSTSNTTLQIYSSANYLGRIMSIYNLVLVGTSPLGNLFSGAIANYAGAGWGFIACGLGVIICYGIYFNNKLPFLHRQGRISQNTAEGSPEDIYDRAVLPPLNKE